MRGGDALAGQRGHPALGQGVERRLGEGAGGIGAGAIDGVVVELAVPFPLQPEGAEVAEEMALAGRGLGQPVVAAQGPQPIHGVGPAGVAQQREHRDPVRAVERRPRPRVQLVVQQQPLRVGVHGAGGAPTAVRLLPGQRRCRADSRCVTPPRPRSPRAQARSA